MNGRTIGFAILGACLGASPPHPGAAGAAAAGTVQASLPDGPIEFRFEAYANNVRVLPPLVADFQLGISRFQGSGTIRDGKVTGTLTDTDDLRRGTRSMSASIVDGTFEEVGGVRRLALTVRITASSHPTDECAPGIVGLLELQDSPDTLANGHSLDFIRLGSWSPADACGTHVHGWNNEDPGPRTRPEFGGPPDGGQWAVVEISGGTGPITGLDEAHHRLGDAAALDLIIAFDLTASMGPSIESLKAKTLDLVRRAEARSPDFRLGIVTYRDEVDADAFWERPLGSISAAELEGLMAGWAASGGGDTPEDMGEALSRAIAMWEREGATARKPVKLVVVVTDAPGKWPDGFGNTHESISRRAFEVDPAHIYPIIVGDNAAALADGARLAEGTGGRMVRAEEGADVADAVLAAVEEGFARHSGEATGAVGGGGGTRAGRGWGTSYLLMGALALLVAGMGVSLLAAHRRSAGPSRRLATPASPAPASGPRVQLFLEITGPDGVPRRVEVDRIPVVLGRDPACDIVLDDPRVSRRHARVVVENGELFLVDLGSAIGILADERPETRARLWTGRDLLLGETRIRVL